ncbi:hypothetical protein LNV23_05890 [Paucibacter sp. DJ1R-11]|nr:hypothetical protein [Paucibacter sp. DJ1R-11]
MANLHKVDGANPTSEKVQGLRRTEVIEIAERKHRALNGRNIELWVDFNPEYPIVKVGDTAEALLSVATRIANEHAGHQSFNALEECPEIRFLFHNGKEYPDAKWRLAQSHDVPSLLFERVKEIVAIKSAKAQKYQNCDEYWLLLTVDFWDPSQDQYIDWPHGVSIDTTPFSKVLLYKPAFRQVVEVQQ